MANTEEKKVQTSASLPEGLLERLQIAAIKTKRSQSEIIEEALRHWLDKNSQKAR